MKENLILRITTILIIILLSFLPLFLSAYLSIFNHNFYKNSFSKYQIYDKYKEVDMDMYNKDVLDYLSRKKESMPDDISLNERELSHMEDVKKLLLSFLFILKFISLVIILLFLLIYYMDKKSILHSISSILIKSGIISLSLGIFLFILFYFGFDISFSSFHALFFAQGTWLFNMSDNIINIYPEGLFFDISIHIFVLKIITASLFIGAGILIQKKFIKKQSSID